MKPAPVTLADVDAAAARIRGLAIVTPCVRSAWLSDITGAEVWLKLETRQPIGAYNTRGAANALARLKAAEPDTEFVVTASAGNHGQAVALAGRHLGVRARVYVPAFAALKKRAALRALGADLIETPTYEEAEAQAHEFANRTGTRFLSPYSDPDVIAGAGTVAREMLAAVSTLDTFIAPVGGGGLLAGTAIVVRASMSGALIIGAEAAASPAYTAALAAGRPVTVEVTDTIADSLAGNMESEAITFPLVRDLVDRVETTTEDEIAEAIRGLHRHEGLVAEGASACAVASVLRAGRSFAGRAVGVIVSGSNIDQAKLDAILAGGPGR